MYTGGIKYCSHTCIQNETYQRDLQKRKRGLYKGKETYQRDRYTRHVSLLCIQEVLSIALIYIYRIRRIKETYQRDLQKRKRGLYKGKETLLKRLVKTTSVYRRQ